MSRNNHLELVDDFIQKYSHEQKFDFTLKKVGNKFVCGFTPVGGKIRLSDWCWWSFVGKSYVEAIEGAIVQAEKNIENNLFY